MVSRLFQMVYLLMESPQMTAKEMARQLEVSERTIYRDLDKLSAAGIPVYANRGKGGGISLLEDYVLDKMVLTTAEKNKILESLQALSVVGYEDEQVAMKKLQSFFGSEGSDWIEIEFSTWTDGGKEEALFRKLKDAVCHHQYIEIAYSSANKKTISRRVRPLKLCFKREAWYLYGYCMLREDYRFFKLRRISDLTIEEAQFEPEKVGKLLEDDLQISTPTSDKTKIKLAINKQMAFRAYDELTNITVQENGDLICEIEVTDLEDAVSYLFSYGSYATLLEPETLRAIVKTQLLEMIKQYE